MAEYNDTFKWYLQKYNDDKTSKASLYPPRNGNLFTPYYSGEDIFKALYSSILNAKKTVDIIVWGFDPAMPLIRADGVWKLNTTYGNLLRSVGKKGVKVRLLLWYNSTANGNVENAVGKKMKYYVLEIKRATAEATKYPELWFKDVEKGLYPNVEVGFRDIKNHDIIDEDNRIGKESASLSWPTDHQKTVTIDYGYENAHGYLMGHNALTDYWDTVNMTHKDPKRELGKVPYHDFSLRIEGPCLHDLQHNFAQSWDDKATKAFKKTPAMADFKKLIPNIKSPGKCKGQILRTRPDRTLNGKQEKEIKRAYMSIIARNPRKFLLITNQYLQYSKWAKELTSYSQKLKNSKYPRELFLFVFTCEPENDGMILRAHQMANELGVSDQFGTAEAEVYNQDTKSENYNKTNPNYAVLGSSQKKLKADLAKIGINTVFCMLKTKVKGATPQNIYVHAKLCIVDDVFITLGSANLNMRSMAVDSEINIISADDTLPRQFREKVMGMYMGGAVKDDINKNTKEFFEKFSKHIQDNQKRVKEKQAVIGHAVPFADSRTASTLSVG